MTLGNEQGAMKEYYEAFVKTLEKNPVEGFFWNHQVFPDESHGSVVLRSHLYGLKAIFDGWVLDEQVDSLQALKQHVTHWSKRLGYAYEPPEQRLNLLGYRLLQAEKTEQAVEVFTRTEQRFPKSANVYDSLGDGLFAADRIAEALESYRKAEALAAEQAHPFLETCRANVKKAEQRLAKHGKTRSGT